MTSRIQRRRLLVSLAALPVLAGVRSTGVLGGTLDFLNVAAGRDPISDPVSLPARLFLSKVIGTSRAQRLKLAKAVLDETGARLARTPDDTAMLMLRIAALGGASRASSLKETVKQRYVDQSRRALDELLKVQEGHPWRKLFDGFWHVEVVRRSGRLGGVMLGASLGTGVDLLHQATDALGERDAAITFSRAVTLLSYNPAKFAGDATGLLETSIKVALQTPEEPVLQVIVEPARVLLGLMAKADHDAVMKQAIALF